ncbi:MAG: hypothetical protein MJE68_02285 [Proteobacteria bacterium]|nr:hypothetical protein [Pseudomonadota bacterium]
MHSIPPCLLNHTTLPIKTQAKLTPKPHPLSRWLPPPTQTKKATPLSRWLLADSPPHFPTTSPAIAYLAPHFPTISLAVGSVSPS